MQVGHSDAGILLADWPEQSPLSPTSNTGPSLGPESKVPLELQPPEVTNPLGSPEEDDPPEEEVEVEWEDPPEPEVEEKQVDELLPPLELLLEVDPRKPDDEKRASSTGISTPGGREHVQPLNEFPSQTAKATGPSHGEAGQARDGTAR